MKHSEALKRKIIENAKETIFNLTIKHQEQLMKEHQQRKSSSIFSFFRSCVKSVFLWMGYDVHNIKDAKWNALSTLNENLAIHWNGTKKSGLRIISQTRQELPALSYSYIGWKSRSDKMAKTFLKITEKAEAKVAAIDRASGKKPTTSAANTKIDTSSSFINTTPFIFL